MELNYKHKQSRLYRITQKLPVHWNERFFEYSLNCPTIVSFLQDTNHRSVYRRRKKQYSIITINVPVFDAKIDIIVERCEDVTVFIEN